jgi:hypothetical protein
VLQFLILLLLWTGVAPCKPPSVKREATPAEIQAYFRDQHKTVLTFLGYSGAEYEDPTAMIQRVREVLRAFNPERTIINIGATKEGIGAVYEIAKQQGFTTVGIVSTQAQVTKTTLSSCVDVVFFVRDASWGGLVNGTDRLSPTSMAMVASSDQLVAIGGGEISRDEALGAQRSGKPVRFIPADMNHALARKRAAQRAQPPPTDFSGAVAAAFGTQQ